MGAGTAVTVGAGATEAPGRTLMVASSRMAVADEVTGRVPCQPGVACNGSVRWRVWSAAAEGVMLGWLSDVRGLNDVKSVNESSIL